jgi:hypothetical protein
MDDPLAGIGESTEPNWFEHPAIQLIGILLPYALAEYPLLCARLAFERHPDDTLRTLVLRDIPWATTRQQSIAYPTMEAAFTLADDAVEDWNAVVRLAPPSLRQAVACQPHTTPAQLASLATCGDVRTQELVAMRPHLPRDVARVLSTSRDPLVRHLAERALARGSDVARHDAQEDE